ncbi:MAG: SoxR reducing system RseC family protein [Caldicoprobacterales bacterium]|jgi:sigma-E factor negative regulatory protein RseC|nr:SoxR reducing system RseC family protein [Clostridiales bacterium]
MNEFGEIIEIKDSRAVVKVKRSSACGNCGACSMGTHPDEMLLTVPNPLQGEVGDQVELELASGQVLKASAITYLIPLFALILGVTAGYVLGGKYDFNQEMGGALLGLLFTFLSFFGIRAMEPRFRQGQQFSPKMVQLIKKEMKGDQENGK